MLSPAEAQKIILDSLPALPAEDCPLAHAHGRVLRAPIVADRDLPPYDRVTMDGYAVRLDTTSGKAMRRTYRIIGRQAAGMIPLTINNIDECVEIATGAMLPAGADAIIPYEDATPNNSHLVIPENYAPATGQNIHRHGSDHKQGETISPAGVRITSREIAAAAACGCITLRVAMHPRIAIITTGDELVEISNPSPAPHQIRRSNDHALRTALIEAGCPLAECVHLHDIAHEIETHLKHIIASHDIVIATGGVSKGRFDLVPEVLAKLGVEKKFQGVGHRPGKPFWFGITQRQIPIFALPGNPVSAYICFYRYVIPALAAMSKRTHTPVQYVTLAETPPPMADPSLTHYIPARIEETQTRGRLAHLRFANTSGDLTALVGTDGFIELAPVSNPPAQPQSAATPQHARFYPWI